MSAMSVLGSGAFTSAGLTMPTTMASLVTGFQMFEDLDVDGLDGNPITGARTPLPKRLVGSERLGALALPALRECAEGLGRIAPLPLVVCAPTARELGMSVADLPRHLLADASLPVERSETVVISDGVASVQQALTLAANRLENGRWSACFVVGVDSLVLSRRVRRRVAAMRAGHIPRDAVVPGEGAAAILLRMEKPGSATAPSVCGHALGAASERPAGACLTALRNALSNASRAAATIDSILVDAGEDVESMFEELAYLKSSMGLGSETKCSVFTPALSFGDVGAAAGVLGIAALAFLQRENVSRGTGVLLQRLTDGSRAAFVVGTDKVRRA